MSASNNIEQHEPTGWDNPTLVLRGGDYEIRSDSGQCFVMLFDVEDEGLIDRTPGAREALDSAMF